MATSMSATSNTKSITYYSGNTNEEKSNYTAKYAGTLAVDYTFYFYGSLNPRASAAGVNDSMNLSQVENSRQPLGRRAPRPRRQSRSPTTPAR